MSVLRYCRSCSGPRPRAAVRCPWCLKDYASEPSRPEHLFAQYQGEIRYPAGRVGSRLAGNRRAAP